VDLNYWGQYYNYITNILGYTNSGLTSSPQSSHPNQTYFSDNPTTKSLLATGSSVTYDTWSYHYETDGIDQDGLYGIDQGTNGLDDDGANGTDDTLEREAPPPYDVPLRGIQVKLRVYEPDTRQIREATVTRGLVPQ
jgi:hypothetical protein